MTTPWTAQHIEYVEQVSFPGQRGGYVCADVDRQLQRITEHMRRAESLPTIPPTAFRRTRLREGYAPAAVDKLLTRIAGWQRELDLTTGATAPRRPGPASAPTVEGYPAGTHPVEQERLVWSRPQQEWVREAQFATRTGSRAYEMDEVDDFLDTVLVAMAKGQALPEISSVRFFPPKFGRQGYDAMAVDRFLDQLALLRPADG